MTLFFGSGVLYHTEACLVGGAAPQFETMEVYITYSGTQSSYKKRNYWKQWKHISVSFEICCV
jgi:hypothetical protein